MTGQYEVLGQGYQLALRKLADPGADLPSLTFASVPEDRASAPGRGRRRQGSAQRPSRPKKPGEETPKRRSTPSRVRRRRR
jgi:hypothetical protein